MTNFIGDARIHRAASIAMIGWATAPRKERNMNHEPLPAQGPVDVNVSRCTVRVKTTVWADKRGLHMKKSLMFLRRQCEGFNVLAEDASAIGAEEVLPRILNLGEVEDGIYEVVVCNESRDYETGYVDDYDYRLVTANVEVRGGGAPASEETSTASPSSP